MRLVPCILLALLLSAEPSVCELYRDIGPLDTLADLKSKFPGAKFELQHPAWAHEQDVLYFISGPGLPGTIVVKFFDARPEWRRQITSETDAEQRQILESLASGNDDSVSVDWVRWVPDEPIPLQRFISKYGPPEEKGFLDDDLQPYREWKRGLMTLLTDDEKSVVRVDFRFTPDEHCAAWKQRYPTLSVRPECRQEHNTPKGAGVKPKKKVAANPKGRP
jgi:hypothetical protein